MAAQIRLTAEWTASAVSGAMVSGDGRRPFAGVSTDSRAVQPEELFIGIRGDRYDGADFAGAALAAGAAGVLVPRGRGQRLASQLPAPAVVIEVDDTTAALQALAHAVRVESGTKVVAITGSAGKTTTKEVTAEFLASRYRVIRNRGNFNNYIGLPLALMELTSAPDVAVVELGMNHAGEISTLVGIAEPDVRVWTNVGEAHLGFFESIDAIADAKAEIFERASPRTLLVANAADSRIGSRLAKFAGRVVSFAVGGKADVSASSVVDRGIDGTTARVTTPVGRVDLATPLIGVANLANILAATAVAIECDIPLAAVAEHAARLLPASHRGEVIRLARGLTVIDDSYNANPTATTGALDVLRRSAVAGRRVAVLGEMLELGDHSVTLHAEVGRAAARVGVDVLLTVGGPAARALADAAVAAGVSTARVRHFGTSEELAAAVAGLVGPGDLVLVKGSRGVRTDAVVERLKAEFA
jgi:UDP-N-acetylmuramoyl-tripeptide--D-alanyl-D-alanine ligase